MTSLSRGKFVIRLTLCVVFLVVLVIVSPGIGTESASFGWSDAWRAQLGLPIDATTLVDRPFVDTDGDGRVSEDELAGFVALAKHIGFGLRFPRTLLALQVGITLAMCGATFQILFRNSLATPYTLGIANGGSLGALLAIRLGWTVMVCGVSSIAISAFGGALLIVVAVFVFVRGSRRLTSNELLLAGVTMGLFCSAMMMFITSVSDERVTFATVRWMMGSLDPISALEQLSLLPMLVPAWIGLMVMSRAMNQYRLGEELAQTRGVNVVVLQGVSVVLCTLATAGVVGYCGPIGFVGLVVPHMAVLLVGSDCRILLPVAGLLGGGFLIVCDWGAQLTMRLAGWITDRDVGSATLPIGVITAIVGVPLFLILLRTKLGRLRA